MLRFLGVPARLALCAVFVLALAGCETLSSFSSGHGEAPGVDYRSTVRTPSLEIPPDLTSPTYDDRFQIKGDDKGSATFSTYERGRAGAPAQQAGRSAVLPTVDKAQLRRDGNTRWLVVSATPEQAWAVVRDFWLSSGFTLSTERPDLGLIETDWAENRAGVPKAGIARQLLSWIWDFVYDTGTRDRFRTRIEPGAEAGRTEIYVSHRGMVETATTQNIQQVQFVWVPREPDPELEAEMLRRMLLRFGTPEEEAQRIVASPATLERARLERTADGAPQLVIDDAFERAWRRVGVALDRIGFTVVDRDRSQGVYYVRYSDTDTADAKKEQSWLDKLAFWRDDPARAVEQYRVRVTGAGERSLVVVQDKAGAADRSETASRMLSLLLGQLK